MKITYTGRQVVFPPAQVEKIQGQFSKLSKLLDGKGEQEAHVVFSHERHLHQAEVTLNYHHHALVGIASDGDPFNALHQAVLKLEKQAVKVREKWRDGKRTPEAKDLIANGSGRETSGETLEAKPGLIHRIRLKNTLRPMTLDEALIELDGKQYVAYCDARTEMIQMLIRRSDGDLDLIEV